MGATLSTGHRNGPGRPRLSTVAAIGTLSGPVYVAVTFVLHVLIAYRMSRSGRTRAHRLGLIAGLSLLYSLLAVVPLSWRFPLDFIPAAAWPTLRVVSYGAMGLYSFIFTFYVFREAAWLALRLGRRLPPDESRRQLLARVFDFGVFGASAAGASVGYAQARSRARVVDVEVPLEKLPKALDGFTIVQISDLHVGHSIGRDYVRGIVDRVNELDADLIAITGDLIDGSVPELREDVAPLGDLRSKRGTFFCTGNHEYYAGALEWIDALTKLGIRTLVNEHVVLEGPLLLAGVTDIWMGHYLKGHRSDPKAALAGADDDVVRVLLAHQPKSAFDAAKAGFDLQLSGHTHGGQFFPWNLVVYLVHPFVAGLDRLGDMWIYTSRGTGYFGPPVRLGAPSEITRIKLRAGVGRPSEA